MKPRTLARHLFPVLLGLSVALVLVSARDAQAQKDPRADAKKHYSEGKRLYETGEYDKAIAEFKAADGLAPSGVNDFNIALAYEALGKPADAIRYYQSYLTRVPNADNRADVQASIDNLEAQASAEDAARRAEAARDAEDAEAARLRAEQDRVPADGGGAGTPSTTGDPELDRVAAVDVGSVRDQRQASMPAPTGGGGGAVAAGGGGGAGGGAAPPNVPAEPKKSKPIYKQWWFWVVAGVSAYVLISILSSNSDNTENQPGFLLMPEPATPSPSAGFTLRF